MAPLLESDKYQNKKIRITLAFKVTLSIISLIIIISSLSIFFVFYLGKEALRGEIREKLALIASNAAITLDVEKLKTIKSNADEGNATYLELQKKLQEVKAASKYKGDEKIMYVYTFRKTGESYEYVLDAAPIEDTENHSSVGDEFPIDEYPEALNGFFQSYAESSPSLDPDFNVYSLSGYAPIMDKDGKTVGVVGVDMNVQTLKNEESSMITAGIIALAAAILFALLSGISFSLYLTRPIIKLTNVTKKVSEGNLDTVVDIKRNDELGHLANSFNLMTQDLKTSHEALRKYSLELEEKVAQRTSELSQINKEIKDILDNMSQAIFTIGPDLKFNAQHSRYAFDIFGEVSFADQNILDVLFGEENQKGNRNNMEFWLNKIFSNTEMSWEHLLPLQPVSEVKVTAKDCKGINCIKYIQINFEPITDLFPPDFKEKVIKIMVILQDITEKKTLELEVERKEQEFKDNIDQIVEIIKMDKELFEEFIKESRDNLLEFEPKLIMLKEDRNNKELINDLFRVMHTLKGNSMIFKLERIAGEAHSIENIFSPIRKGEAEMTDELLAKTFKRLDRFNVLFNETLDIYNKIIKGFSADTGKTRSAQRQQEDSEIIKVKVHELNRLTSLIKEADRLLVEDISSSVSTNTAKEKIQKMENIFKETEEYLKSIRKISLGRLFARFPRMVHDISAELGKKVKLVISGDQIEVDKNIFDKVGDPLVHIIRNSVDHGIEKPEERLSLEKTAEGTIDLSASINDQELQICINDDGKGLDPDRIKSKAVTKGLLTPAKALEMTDDEAIKLIFLPGFSTNDQITSISGRGVGMDVVKTYIEDNLRGTIHMETTLNAGLKLTLRIPLETTQEI